MAKKSRQVSHVIKISIDLAEKMGFEHLDTVFEKEPTGMYLRVYLDKPGGVDLNDCEAYHRAIKERFDEFEYDFLEVCSAGIDRPIKNLRDSKKAMNKMIEIKLFKPLDGRKKYVGILVKYDEQQGFTLRIGDEYRQFAIEDVALACRTVDLGILEEQEMANKEEKSE